MLLAALGISGFLLLIAFTLVPVVGGASETLQVIAVASVAMPLYAARAMPMVLMERKLHFGRVAIVETADTLAFNGFALLAALAGLGAFSLSGAVPAGALAGACAAWAIQPFTRRPRLELEPVRPLIGFGVRISILQGVYLLRELGFVGIVAAIGGTSVAGYYAMAKRLFSFPIALTSAVNRVSFPTLSRDEALRPERTAKIATHTALVAGLPLALVAGAAQPLIAVVLGDEWLPTTDVVLIGSLGMMLTASACATMISSFMAEGDASYPLASATAETTAVLGLAALLTGAMGEVGVGIAFTVSSIVGTLVLALGAPPGVRRSLIAIGRSVLIAAAATGVAQALDIPNDATGLGLAIATVTVVWLVLEVIFARHELRELIGIARPMLRRARNA